MPRDRPPEIEIALVAPVDRVDRLEHRQRDLGIGAVVVGRPRRTGGRCGRRCDPLAEFHPLAHSIGECRRRAERSERGCSHIKDLRMIDSPPIGLHNMEQPPRGGRTGPLPEQG